MVSDAYRWYDSGTIATHRPRPANAFRRISVKLCRRRQLPAYRKTTTLCRCKVDDKSLSILTHQTIATPGDLGLSCLKPSLPLSPMIPTYLWSSLRSFPIPWPCSLPFHHKSSFYTLSYTAYFPLLTIVLLIHCLVVISRVLASVLPIA
jgi:hypothetical protein